MSTFGASRKSGWYPWGDVLSINPRPTRVHELLDVDRLQPFEFRGDMYHTDGCGRVRQIDDSWTNTKETCVMPTIDPDVITDMLNNPDKILRTRVVDNVGIMKSFKTLGMRYLLCRPSLGGFYLFQDPVGGISFEKLCTLPPDTLKQACDLYVPGDSSLWKDLLVIMGGVRLKDLAWMDKILSYAIDIDDYLERYGGNGPIYEKVL